VRLAAIYPPAIVAHLARHPEKAARLRADCYLAADAALPRPQADAGQISAQPTVTDPPPAETLEDELSSPETIHLLRHGRFDLYFICGDSAPQMLRALGCAREVTFRAAGQGTGTSCDLAAEDQHYHHLLLWDGGARRLAGAYRVGIIPRILSEHGPAGLYLNHVFKINPRLYTRLGSAFELSRSFVHPDYQRDRDALAGLWKGLGAAALREGAGTFFGSVTISNAHHPASRALLVEHLRKNHADIPEMCALVRARTPFVPATRYHRLVASAYHGEPISSLSPLIRRIEEDRRDIPPLMRYYCGLGARFLAFHVEASFRDALYCLLRVELAQIPPAYKKRFLPTA
jgi:putative hemolysin